MTEATPTLSVKNLVKEYPSVTAVDNVSFDVEDEEFVSILGPSGSGKSTILRMIAGFESPTDGTISIGSSDVTSFAPFDRNVNMVFQSLALFPHLTVAENIGFGLKQRGISKDERRDRIEEMLEIVELEGYGDRDPSELSGGEQQRVALARALVNRPQIVLFDEPLASLDRKLRQHMQTELQRIQNETGITFLYVTHDQEVALAVSDRMILLNEGEIEQIGTSESIYDRPVSEFAGDFIGDVNSIPGRVESNNGILAVTVDDSQTIAANIRTPDGFTPEQNEDVSVCIRPEDLIIGPENADSGIPGQIVNRVYTGSGMTYTIDSHLGEFTANVDTTDYDIGDEVTVQWADETIHVFPESS